MSFQYNVSDPLTPIIPLILDPPSTTPESTQYKLTDMAEFRAASAIVLYLFPLVIIAGTVGNSLAFAVLMRKPMRDTSVYFYLAMLAIADTCVLYLSGFKTWIRTLVHYELLHASNASCKIIMFLFLVSMHMAAWLVVAMTVDRFVAVWFPFKASEVCIVQRARLTTAVIFLAIIIYNSHVFFTIHLWEVSGKGLHCGPLYDDYFMVVVFPKMRVISYSVLPFILVLLFNLAIIVKLCSNSSLLKGATVNTSVNAQHKVTVMLLVVSLVWLVLTAPFTIEPLARSETMTHHQRAKRFLLKTICFLLLYVNHSVNFYIYCVTGKKFRHQLTELFCHCLGWCSSRQRRRHYNIDTRTTKTTHTAANRETILLKNTVLVTYNE